MRAVLAHADCRTCAAACDAAERRACREAVVDIVLLHHDAVDGVLPAVIDDIRTAFARHQLPLNLRCHDPHASHGMPAATVPADLEQGLSHLLRRRAADVEEAPHERRRADHEFAVETFERAVYGRNLVNPSVRTLFRPQESYSGDVFLVRQAADGSIMALLADLTGHGLAAAFFAVPLAEIFHNMVARSYPAETILRALNERLCALLPTGVYVGLQFVEIERDLATVRAANCAMQSIWMVSADGVVSALDSHSIAAGIDVAGFRGDALHPLRCAPGTRILLASDGLVEAENRLGEAFGATRLRAVIERAGRDGQPLVDAVVRELDGFLSGSELHDDLSVVEISCDAALIGDCGAFVAEA
ncbi:MAG: serine/threonine-protein phosphatase [Gammaproteobacteria bacterium]|nr:serine/threonine-protein phosphatase [Gammaproteobacteria bacterium]MCP5199950.1 serine/threonine-protein phosphatase [Gammaproteobacteria bacterium]